MLFSLEQNFLRLVCSGAVFLLQSLVLVGTKSIQCVTLFYELRANAGN